MATDKNLLLREYVYSEDRLALLDEKRRLGDISEADYYFFKLLCMQTATQPKGFTATQNEDEFAEVAEDARIKNLLFRQCLEQVNDTSLAAVRDLTQAKLDHQKPDPTIEQELEEADYPSKYTIDTQKELMDKFQTMTDAGLDLAEFFTPSAADFLAQQKLTDEQIDQFLVLCADEPSDINYLTTLVTKHLKTNEFGSRKMHRKLTKDQLRALQGQKKDLKTNEVFMGLLASKLRTVDDSRLEVDLVAKGRCLTTLKNFALDEIANDCPTLVNLKGLILYHYLAWTETVDKIDTATFREYLKVPKRRKRKYEKPAEISALTGKKIKRVPYGIKYNYTHPDLPYLPAIGSDNEYALVDRYCHNIFLNGEKPKDWVKELLDPAYCVPIFAEEMLCAGKGNEKFQASQLEMIARYRGQKAWRKINKKVVLCLSRGNIQTYTAEDEVVLKVEMKNVAQLTVRVYQINCRAYYIAKQQEVPLDVNVHGANPIKEWSLDYMDPPAMKNIRAIAVPELKGKRGTFIIEMSGSGQKTRALIRKGEYRYIMEQTSEGQVFKIVNEYGEPVPEGRIWMDGIDFEADESGEIVIPFGDKNEPKKIVMDDASYPGDGSLGVYDRLAPAWMFNCGVYIDRENLLEKREAKVVVRPNLYMCNELVSVAKLTDAKMLLVTTDARGATASQVKDVELVDESETAVPFIVPVDIREVKIIIKANLDGMAVQDEDVFNVNGIDASQYVADIYLSARGNDGYCLSVWGKNAEPYTGTILEVKCTHRFFADPVEFRVQTDDGGNCWLGRLTDCTAVEVTPVNNKNCVPNQKFDLLLDKVNVPIRVNAMEGKEISIPCPSGNIKGPNVKVFDDQFRECFNDCCTYTNGYIRVNNIPSGDFVMFVRDEQNYRIGIHVSKGQTIDNRFGQYVISPEAKRILQLSEYAPLHVSKVNGDRTEGYTVTLDGVNEKTRVHVLANHFCPRFSVYDYLKAPSLEPDIIDFESPLSSFSAQKAIEEEYRYVYDRKSPDTVKSLGNILPFPNLHINSWSPDADLRPREAEIEQSMEDFAKAQKSRFQRGRAKMSNEVYMTVDQSNLDFLYEPSRAYCNLPLDNQDGGLATLTISSDMYSNNHNILKVIAVDDDNISVKNIILSVPDTTDGYADVTVGSGPGTLPFENDTRYIQRQAMYTCESGTIVGYEGGDQQAIDNGVGASYNSIRQMVDLWRSVAKSKDLAREGADAGKDLLRKQMDAFVFLGEWDNMSNDEKLAAYDNCQCNEFNYFCFVKDPEFFSAVCVPNMQDKARLHQRFFDCALLMIAGESLEDCPIHPYLEADASLAFANLNAFERFLRAQALEKTNPNEVKQFQRYLDDSMSAAAETSWAVRRHMFKLGVTGRSQTRDVADGVITAWPCAYTAPTWVESEQGVEVTTTGIALTRASEPTGYFQYAAGNDTRCLVQPSAWLREYADFVFNQTSDQFRSVQIFKGTSNITEMLLALAVTDLPSNNKPMQLAVDGQGKITGVQADAGTGFLFLQQVVCQDEAVVTGVACSGAIYDPNTDELAPLNENDTSKLVCLPRRVYKGRVVLTNQGATDQEVEVVVQIPHGAIPAKNGFRFQVIPQVVPAFTTIQVPYHFYFPRAMETNQANISITQGKNVIAYKENHDITVLPSKPLTKWEKVAVNGSADDVLAFLKDSPIYAEDLTLICYRFSDDLDFTDTTDILRKRGVYDEAVWAYSLNYSKNRTALGEYLAMNRAIQNTVAPCYSSDLFTIDQDLTLDWSFRDFQPMIHRRFYQGEMDDPAFQKQYGFFLTRVAFNSTSVADITTIDRLTGIAYFLQQNRIAEARDTYNTLDLDECRGLTELVSDFLGAYLSLCCPDPTVVACDAQTVVTKYKDNASLLPSQRAFVDAIEAQLAESEDPTMSDDIFLKEELAEAARRKLDFVKNKGPMINITYDNIDKITINFYKVDPEIQFSMIFCADDEMYKFVKPNLTTSLDLDADASEYEFKIPRQLVNHNFLAEMVHEESGLRIAKKCFDNDLVVQTASKIGEVRVLDEDSLQPLELVYVKVYGRTKVGQYGVFFKDGYTDVRGRFNYRDVSFDQLSCCDRLAILCWTETMGSSVVMIDV